MALCNVCLPAWSGWISVGLQPAILNASCFNGSPQLPAWERSHSALGARSAGQVLVLFLYFFTQCPTPEKLFFFFFPFPFLNSFYSLGDFLFLTVKINSKLQHSDCKAVYSSKIQAHQYTSRMTTVPILLDF